ncbi:hypothetical protein F5888DRAFT_1888408 [Russula emetica]|nr:hypothetical protein F5888DRAFT_1888408 [Russula emetica]
MLGLVQATWAHLGVRGRKKPNDSSLYLLPTVGWKILTSCIEERIYSMIMTRRRPHDLRVKMVLQVTCSLPIFTSIKPQLCLGKLQESVTMNERSNAGQCLLAARNYELLLFRALGYCILIGIRAGMCPISVPVGTDDSGYLKISHPKWCSELALYPCGPYPSPVVNVKAVGSLVLATFLKVGHGAQRSSAIKNFELGIQDDVQTPAITAQPN